MKREIRSVQVTAERRDEDGGKPILCGMPIVYDSPSELIYGYFREYIKPGAFDECLASSPDILCFRDHDPARVLGRTGAKTLRMIPKPEGVGIECDMPNTTYGLDLAESIRRGDIRGMSFGFDVLDDEWYMKDGVRNRDVTKAKLYEVSFLVNPAYPGTSVSVRDLDALRAEVDKRFAPNNTELARRRLRILALGHIRN